MSGVYTLRGSFHFSKINRPGLLKPPAGYFSDPAELARLDDASDRILAAQLKAMRMMRGGGELIVEVEQASIFSWFQYRLCGLRSGIVEGVLLRRGDRAGGRLSHAVTDHAGASLIRLTRKAPDPVAEPGPECRFLDGWLVIRRETQVQELLNLAATYEATLAGLGKHTRRNMRAAGRQAVARSLAFEVSTDAREVLPRETRAALSRQMQPLGLPGAVVARLEAYVDATGRPFRTVVRTATGNVVSYCCGYLDASSTAYLLYQLNDMTQDRIGPSLLHRSMLVQWLIGRGYTELVFVGGCSGILKHACVPLRLEVMWLMRRSMAAYARAAVLGLLRPRGVGWRLLRAALAGAGRDGGPGV